MKKYGTPEPVQVEADDDEIQDAQDNYSDEDRRAMLDEQRDDRDSD